MAYSSRGFSACTRGTVSLKPVAKQHIMLLTSWWLECKNIEKTKSECHNPLQGNPVASQDDLRSPTRPHILKVPLPPISSKLNPMYTACEKQLKSNHSKDYERQSIMKHMNTKIFLSSPGICSCEQSQKPLPSTHKLSLSTLPHSQVPGLLFPTRAYGMSYVHGPGIYQFSKMIF